MQLRDESIYKVSTLYLILLHVVLCCICTSDSNFFGVMLDVILKVDFHCRVFGFTR